MVPSHIPILLKIYCASIICDNMNHMQDLLRTNIGPIINHNDYISCSRLDTSLIECDVYSPWKESCKCCHHLRDTFTPEALSDITGTSIIEEIEIDCTLPKNYKKC